LGTFVKLIGNGLTGNAEGQEKGNGPRMAMMAAPGTHHFSKREGAKKKTPEHVDSLFVRLQTGKKVT